LLFLASTLGFYLADFWVWLDVAGRGSMAHAWNWGCWLHMSSCCMRSSLQFGRDWILLPGRWLGLRRIQNWTILACDGRDGTWRIGASATMARVLRSIMKAGFAPGSESGDALHAALLAALGLAHIAQRCYNGAVREVGQKTRPIPR